MEVLLYLAAVYFGALGGFFLGMWVTFKPAYVGTILVSKKEEGTIYSLVLEDNPELIELEKEVLFKIDIIQENTDVPEENLNRS